MKQKQFETEQEALWQDLGRQLDAPNRSHFELPQLYRRLCQSLALSLQRGYAPSLTAQLKDLVLRCHSLLYGTVVARPMVLRQWLMKDFPCTVREEWRLLLIIIVLFYGTSAALALLVYYQPHWAYSFTSADELSKYERMYSSANVSLGRSGDQGDVYMFCFYIWNNVSIGFRCFAAGLFGALPSMFMLISNAVHFGVVAGWLSRNPDTAHNFWTFVPTHSSFEVTGLLLTALAGFRMGLALVRPGRRLRGDSLREAGRRMMPVVTGASLMIFLAAFFEAFWSASTTIPAVVKWTGAGICWTIVIAYFSLAGRGSRA